MGVFRRIIKNKNGKQTEVYYGRIDINKKDKWFSLGKVGIITKAVAESRLHEIKKKVRLGQLNEVIAIIPTLKEFTNDYIIQVRDIDKKRSWKRDELCLKHLNNYFTNIKLSEFTSDDVDNYKEYRLESVAPATVNRELEVLRHLFNVADKKDKFFSKNPVSRAGLLNVDNKMERILTNKEEIKLLNSSGYYLRNIITCALNTALRKGEIISLKWNNVDLKNNIITIDSYNSKSKKLRKVPINSLMRKLFLELKLQSEGNEFVFLSSERKPYTRQDSLNRAFQRALQIAGIQGLRFHDLRHTCATRMIENGANIVAVKEILGHSSLDMTMRYAHPEKSLKNALQSLVNI